MSSTDGKKNSFRYSDEHMRETGLAVAQVSRALLGDRQLSVDLVGINIKRPSAVGGEILAVVKGLDAEGTPCVAFHSAFTLEELVRGLESRLANGSLKWRVDEFMAGRT